MVLDSILWLVAVAAFIAVEAATTALVSAWFALGAGAALLVSFFSDNVGMQFIVFAVVSAVSLAIMVPTLAKHRKEHQAPVTNGSPLTIGKRGVVLAAINPGEVGRVRVDGLDWQAKADEAIPAGSRCTVRDVDGAILIVVPATLGATAAEQ